MTTWPGLHRRLSATRFALLLAAVLVCPAATADAAVTATVVAGQLRVTGDGASDGIRLLLSSDGLRIEIWNGVTPVDDFPRSSFTTILVDAGGAGDTVTIDEINGVFTDTEITTILGGPGNDTLTGGTGAETIQGGAGNDTIDGGRGADTLRGEAGIDTFLWSSGATIFQPSDGSDTIDGGDEIDTLSVVGTDFAETWSLAANGQRALLARSGGAISLDLGTVEKVQLSLLGGDDIFLPSLGLPTPIDLEVSAGDGNDTVSGGDGNDRILGGNGDDSLGGGPGVDIISGDGGDDTIFGDDGHDGLNGNAGNDTISGGAGDDLASWNSGDGIDLFDGQGGTDRISVSGGNLNDDFAVTAPASGFQVVHNLLGGAITGLTTELLAISTFAGSDDVEFDDDLAGRFQSASVFLGDGNDTLRVNAATPPVFADGNADQDTLTFRALNAPVDVTPSTFAAGGVVRATHVNFEQVNLTETVGALPLVTIVTPTTNPNTTSSVPFIALGGTASDAGGSIQSVTWSTSDGDSGTASGTTQWTIADVPLRGNSTVITVSAHDDQGNSRADVLSVTVSTLTYLLAEGATGAFFDLDVLIANPNGDPAPVTVTFLRQTGTPITQNLTLTGFSRTTIRVDDVPGLESEGGVSTLVASTTGLPLIVERTMSWDATGYGAHGGTAVDTPRTRWLFAEGSEGFFNTFVLLANPGGSSSASTVTLTFLREGSTPFTHVVTVPPAARVTVAANAIPELVGRAFSIVVDATTPIIAERAMYFGTARLFDGGHESTGVSGGATSWFLAEGATGSFFTTFVLVGNPNPAPANLTLNYLTGTGQTVVRNKVVPANGRLTVNIATEDPILANAAVATTVTADQPVVAERAMYWPGPPATWAEAHNSFGATTLWTRWGLAEGRVGMAQAFQTYILLANPSATAADVSVTFLRANGAPVVKTFTVNPTSRFNVDVSGVPELANETFGALIQVTNGVGISVERAMYSNALGQFWAAGTNALATRLP